MDDGVDKLLSTVVWFGVIAAVASQFVRFVIWLVKHNRRVPSPSGQPEALMVHAEWRDASFATGSAYRIGSPGGWHSHVTSSGTFSYAGGYGDGGSVMSDAAQAAGATASETVREAA